MYQRFKHLLPAEVGGKNLYHELNHKIAIFKYMLGDQFKPHTDGIFPGQVFGFRDCRAGFSDGVLKQASLCYIYCLLELILVLALGMRLTPRVVTAN